MECRATSINGIARSRRSLAGETLSSTLIGLMMAGMLLCALGVVYLFASRSFASLNDLIDLDSSSRLALDKISRDIRQADRLSACTSNVLTLQFGTNNLIYQWSPDAKTLTRRFANEPSKTILRDCNFLRYDIFRRNLTNGSYDYYPAAVATNTKVVQVTLGCSRTVLGRSSGTSGFQSAKIVIRNQK
jgi:Tfp pilus assembly protein PilW